MGCSLVSPAAWTFAIPGLFLGRCATLTVAFWGTSVSAEATPNELHLLHALQCVVGPVVGLHALPDARPWSRTYRVELEDGDSVFLKGTPRSRAEATTTTLLASRCPTYLPAVLHSDLIPASAWRWFLTAHAGDCGHAELPPELAEQAAFALGRVQRVAHTDPLLARILPGCLPRQLQHVALASCDWLMQQGYSVVETYRTRIAGAAPAFAALGQHLAALPPTCVHGDFWPGNIAVEHKAVKLIDWGEAVWGIGGVSIWNLLLTSHGTLADHQSATWNAYARGWGRSIPQEYIAACRIAFPITTLVVDYGYVDWHEAEIDIAPSMLTTIQQLVRQLEAAFAVR